MAEGKEQNSQESVLLAWRALEYPEYTRDWRYYTAVGSLFLLLMGYSIWVRDWYSIVVILLLIGFILWYQTKKPVQHTYRLSQLGIYVDSHFYPYHDIYSFWLLLAKDHKSLNIIFAKKYLPQLSILMENVDPVAVRTTMGKYVPEEHTRTESATDKFVRWFKL